MVIVFDSASAGKPALCTGYRNKRQITSRLTNGESASLHRGARDGCLASAGTGETLRPSYTTTRQESHLRKPWKNYTPVEKVAILRRHLIDRVRVSDLCDQHQLSPTLFYTWQKQFFENGPAAFERKNAAPEGHLQRTIAALRDKLQRKNEVVAELIEGHIKLNSSFPKNCTFPENTEPAATGQGVVSVDFSARQVSGSAGPGEDRRGKPPARWTVCLRPNGSSDCPESSEE